MTVRMSQNSKVLVRRVKWGNDRVTEPWWADCPQCPVINGFDKFETHGRALMWALKHIEHHRKEAFIKLIKDRRSRW